jgi:hypothetical protein
MDPCGPSCFALAGPDTRKTILPVAHPSRPPLYVPPASLKLTETVDTWAPIELRRVECHHRSWSGRRNTG